MTDETKQVLVVDDDELARMEIAHAIEKQGHSVSQAENGAQALEMLQAGIFLYPVSPMWTRARHRF